MSAGSQTRSHRYELGLPEVVRLAGAPLGAFVVIAVVVRLAAVAGLLPDPWPALDADRAILVSQASRSADPATARAAYWLVGDSSCLMDVDAGRLSERRQAPVVNLGTLSFVDLDVFGELIQRAGASSEPHSEQVVVLLVHPEFLRRAGPSRVHVDAFHAFLAGDDHDYSVSRSIPSMVGRWAGVSILTGRVIGRLPVPLEGAFAREYGFTTGLIDSMNARFGSAVDPRELSAEDLRGSNRYRVSVTQRQGAAGFRRWLPENSRLVVGLTPVPEGFADPEYPTRIRELLSEWARELSADHVLDALPLVLPDDRFATKTHLNRRGQAEYTAILSSTLPSAGRPVDGPR